MREMTKVLVLAVLVSLAMYLLLVPVAPPAGGPKAVLQQTTFAPKIAAAGWINGQAPNAEDFKGKVVVIDAWATWCGPCLEAVPELKRIHNRFADRDDVVFIGLTSEGKEDLAEIKQFLNRAGIGWLNGYGAEETLQALEAIYIPRTYVLSREGLLVWADHPMEGLESAIEQTLELPDSTTATP